MVFQQSPFKTKHKLKHCLCLPNRVSNGGLGLKIQNLYQWTSPRFDFRFPQTPQQHNFTHHLTLQVSQDRKGPVQRLQSRPHQTHADHLRVIPIGVHGRLRRGGRCHCSCGEICGPQPIVECWFFFKASGEKNVSWVNLCVCVYKYIYICTIYIWSSRLRFKLTMCGLSAGNAHHGCWPTIHGGDHHSGGGQNSGPHVWGVAWSPGKYQAIWIIIPKRKRKNTKRSSRPWKYLERSSCLSEKHL